MDEAFKALADPSRRRLLDRLNARNGQTLRELCSELAMARQSVSKHLAVLEGANLVTTLRRGREKLHYLNAAPINDIAERWITHYDRPRVQALADLKRSLEDSSMSRPQFVYTTYIKATPEWVWEALTQPAFTKRYWDTAFETDWAPGSPMVWDHIGVRIEDPEQVVYEADPPRRLSYAWHTFTPEWAAAVGIDAERRARLVAEPRTRVTFELEPAGDATKLTVIHDGFDAGSLIGESVARGWPAVLAQLKTLVETGEELALAAPDAAQPA